MYFFLSFYFWNGWLLITKWNHRRICKKMLGLETKSWLQLEFWILILELSLFFFLLWHPVCDLVHVWAHSLREKISDANWYFFLKSFLYWIKLWSWSSSPWAGRWQRTLVLSWSVSRRSCAGSRQEPGKMLIDDTKDCINVWIKTGFAIFFSPSSWQDTAMVRIKKCLYSVY